MSTTILTSGQDFQNRLHELIQIKNSIIKELHIILWLSIIISGIAILLSGFSSFCCYTTTLHYIAILYAITQIILFSRFGLKVYQLRILKRGLIILYVDWQKCISKRTLTAKKESE